MEWWEAILFLLGYLVGGWALFGGVIWLASQLGRMRRVTSSRTSTLPFSSKKPEAASVLEEQPKLIDSKLMAEVEHNLRISSQTWTGELVPFDTRAWDIQKHDLCQLPTNLRNDLTQAYTDICLANQIVWLSTEFNRSSPNIHQGYRRMSTSISERLHRIKQYVAAEGGQQDGDR